MQKLLGIGILMVLAGFGLLLLGSSAQGNVSAGGVIFIGPVPIVFGTGPEGWQLALLSVAIGALMVVLLFVWSRRLAHSGSAQG